MENQTFNIKTGDIIITETSYFFIEHFGVVVVENHITHVYHCTPSGNVQIDTVSDFLKNRELKSVRHTGATKYNIIKRYTEVKDRKYDLDEFNCTHFANFVTGR